MRIPLSRSRATLLLCICALASIRPAATAQNPVDAEGEQRLLALINQERVAAGLASLKLDSHLTQAARKHTQRMIDEDSIVHQLPGEDPLLLRLVAEDIRTDHDGENVALNSSAELAHQALMQSPGHRANILGAEFNAVGIAAMWLVDQLYVTEDFAHVLPSYTDFEADAAAQQAITDYVHAHNMPTPERRTRTQLTRMACDMAKEDKIDAKAARDILGTTSSVAWTATDLHKLPPGLRNILGQPLNSGYSLGVCFASSKTYLGGVYWLIFVTY